MLKRINFYDCDGILLNSTHRFKAKNGKLDLDYWIENSVHEKIMQDELEVLAPHYKRSLANPEIFTVIATARACTLNDSNYQVINEKLGKPDLFIHREGVGDQRGGAELKIEGMLPYLLRPELKGAKIHVYEDNHDYLHDVCHGLKSEGFEVVGHYNPSEQGI